MAIGDRVLARGHLIEVWFDGAVEPVNPGGHGVSGIVIHSDGVSVHENGRYLGSGPGISNNVAEYRAVGDALDWMIHAGVVISAAEIIIRGDSLMAINQLAGRWSVRTGLYIKMYERARDLLADVRQQCTGPVELKWVRRDENAHADAICRRVLEARGITSAVRRSA